MERYCFPSLQSVIGAHMILTQTRAGCAAATLIALISASTASTAYAVEPRFYVAADVGQSKYKTSTSDLGVFGGSIDTKDTTLGAAVGIALSRNIAFELGYTDFGRAKVSGQGSVRCQPAIVCLPVVANVSGSAEAKATHFSMVANAPLTDTVSIFGRFGAARTDRSADVRVGATPAAGGEKKTEAIYGVGLAATFTQQIDGTLEWKRLEDTKVDAVSIGLRYRF
jgi:opacity protein-like surface antigen